MWKLNVLDESLHEYSYKKCKKLYDCKWRIDDASYVLIKNKKYMACNVKSIVVPMLL